MRVMLWGMVTLAISGCGSGVDPEAQRCGALPDIPAYSRCIEIYNARTAARAARSDAEDTTAWSLLGATAFMNGYNQARPQPMLTCYNTGVMTMCQ
jgi:hypothetical protein